MTTGSEDPRDTETDLGACLAPGKLIDSDAPAVIHLGGRWVKATPAFNRSLCDKIGIASLEFDGEHDSVFQPLDLEGRRHMEYVRDRGVRLDVPFDEMWAAWREVYGSRVGKDGDGDWRDFEREAHT